MNKRKARALRAKARHIAKAQNHEFLSIEAVSTALEPTDHTLERYCDRIQSDRTWATDQLTGLRD